MFTSTCATDQLKSGRSSPYHQVAVKGTSIFPSGIGPTKTFSSGLWIKYPRDTYPLGLWIKYPRDLAAMYIGLAVSHKQATLATFSLLSRGGGGGGEDGEGEGSLLVCGINNPKDDCKSVSRKMRCKKVKTEMWHVAHRHSDLKIEATKSDQKVLSASRFEPMTVTAAGQSSNQLSHTGLLVDSRVGCLWLAQC